MKEWFLGLAPRERLVVLGGAGVAALLLAYVAVVEPLVRGYEQRVERVAALERDLAWMMGAAAEVRSLHAGGAGDGATDTERPAYLVVDEAVREAGLPQPDRLEPAGNSGARVEFGEVAFDDLIEVIGQLERSALLQVTQARFGRIGEGRVNAQLTLEREPS